MTSAKNEFIIGCIIGGVIGAATALLMPRKSLNGFFDIPLHSKNSHAHSRAQHHHRAGTRAAEKKEAKGHHPARKRSKKTA